jgi:putative ABC transport system permease protein
VWLIAIKMLLSDRAKYFGLILGIAFSTLLITNQGGIFLTVLDQTVRAIKQYRDADVWVMKPDVESIETPIQMPYVFLGRIQGIPGVQWAVPFYSGGGRLKTESGLRRNVSIYGLDDLTLFGAPEEMVLGDVEDLIEPNSIILDSSAFETYFPGQPYRSGDIVEIGSRRAKIVGLCKTNWTGMVYTRLSNALSMEGQPGRMASYFVVHATDGYDPDELAERISSQTGLKAKSKKQFIEMSIDHIYRTSGMVEAFGTTIIIGLIVGIVIVGQTFYMFILDNLKQFAALKAIGIGNGTIVSMLLIQAAMVTFVGFGLGIGASALLFHSMDSNDSQMRGMVIPWSLLLGSAAVVTLIVVCSCVVSSLRVLLVDPAIVYRG